LEADVASDGRVRSVRVIGSPNPDFAAAAVAAVRQWLYKPATLGGDPIDVCIAVRITFNL
jgi:TonB family protein